MKRGFTLIELLAVIIVLSLILVIAVPQVLKAINDSKRASLLVTTNNLIDSADKYATDNYSEMEEINEKKFTIESGEFVGDSLRVSTDLPDGGEVAVDVEGDVSVAVIDNDLCAIKTYYDSEIIITDNIEDCEIELTTPENCFVFEDGTIYNYNYTNANCPSDIIIPRKINGTAVTKIGIRAFAGFDSSENRVWNITSVKIPDTITYIGDEAFTGYNYKTSGCAGELTEIAIPSSVINIGMSAFDCNHIKNVIIPDSVTTLGCGAFYHNELESAVISNNITEIGCCTFCSNNLTSITIPSSIKSIWCSAFANNKLTSITIPSSVTETGCSMFYNNQLTSATIENGGLTYIGSAMFAKNNLTSITIPNSVTRIYSEAFRYNFIPQDSARIDNVSGNVTIDANVFANNGTSKTTTITPIYLR